MLGLLASVPPDSDPPQAGGDRVRALRARIAAAPDDIALRRELDGVLLELRRYDEVIATWDEYLARNPQDGRGYLERGGTHTYRRDGPAALKDLDRACSLGEQLGCEQAAKLRAMFAKMNAGGAEAATPVPQVVAEDAADAEEADDDRASLVRAVVLGLVTAVLIGGGTLVSRQLKLRRQSKPSTVGGPRAKKAREEAAEGHLTSVVQLLRGTPDPELRWLYLSTLSGVPLDSAERLVAAHPDDPVAHVLLGYARVWAGKEARGTAVAEDTSLEAFEAFEALALSAVEAANRACALAPEDPVPWLIRLSAFYGLGVSVPDIMATFQEAVRRAPGHFGAHDLAAHLMSPKWFGDADTLLDFARTAAAEAPDGSDLPILVLRAHFEIAMAAAMTADDEAAKAYVQRKDVRDECRAAYARSLGHPAYRERAASVDARNQACGLFYFAEMNELLARELDKLGYAYTSAPWVFLARSPRAAFAAARVQARLS